MQQRPVRTSQRPTSHVARVVFAVGAALAAIALAGRPTPTGSVVTTSTGNVAATLAPALPRRSPPVVVPAPTDSTSASTTVPVPTTPRERLALGAAGTYIGEILRVRDSAVVRWPDRVERPLTVWVGAAPGVADWRPAYLARVVDAFAEWTRVGVPVRFRFVHDSSAAEVHVGWTDRFREPISGRTVWSRDENWWMTDANITIALHHNDGNPLDEEQVRAIALHEVGHLLGLDHTNDPTSVMAARVRVRGLSAADQATARLIYAVPAGHL
ncbi:hypothetical protein tb265_08080 [Gemmatimonadetes bacterium T265]|nr:hypothetical protein tb265_08080 [Gemmatimonadetes bacterium T265]